MNGGWLGTAAPERVVDGDARGLRRRRVASAIYARGGPPPREHGTWAISSIGLVAVRHAGPLYEKYSAVIGKCGSTQGPFDAALAVIHWSCFRVARIPTEASPNAT